MYHDQFAPIYTATSPKRQPLFPPTGMSQQSDSQYSHNLPANSNPVTILPSSMPASTMDGNATNKRVAITNLMSPPEPRPHETFTHTEMSAPDSTTIQTEGKGKGRAKPMISPPESPAIATSTYPDVDAARDPILYPSSRDYLTSTASSLFSQPKQDHPDHVDVATLVQDLRRDKPKPENCLFEVLPPSANDHPGYVRLVSRLGECIKADPKGWYRARMEELKADKEARKRRRDREERERKAAIAARLKDDSRRRVAPSPASDEIRVSDKALKPHRPARVTKPAAKLKQSSTPPKPAHKPAPKPAPAKLTPEGSPPGDKHSPIDNKHSDFQSLPDYCPPLSSLPPGKPNWFKIDWKGVPSVLKDDPNRHLLHSDEVRLAETLKLDCALYLAAKRRFFMRRLECARIGKAFRKTDAQQACRIDVNKASRLWVVFERVGWLEERWVKPFL